MPTGKINIILFNCLTQRIIAFFLFLFSIASVHSQSIGLRFHVYNIENYYYGDETGETTFWGPSWSTLKDKSRAFVTGVFFQKSFKNDLFYRVSGNYFFRYTDEFYTWNLENNEYNTLKVTGNNSTFDLSVSVFQKLSYSKFGFNLGLELGGSYTPEYRKNNFYSFYDSLQALDGSGSIVNKYPSSQFGFIKLYGGIYYHILPKFSLGVDLSYGPEFYYSEGDYTTDYKEYDNTGQLIFSESESYSGKEYGIRLPNLLNLPMISLKYDFILK